MRLQTKILFLLVPLIVLPLLALGWAAYAQMMDDAHDRTRRQMTTLLEQIQVHTETQMRTARANASLFASQELVQRYARSTASTRKKLEPEVRDLLFNYQLAYPEYYEIRIVSPEGEEQIRSILGKVRNKGTDESASVYFQEASAQAGVTYSTFFRNPDNNRPAMLVSKPLLFLPGEFSSMQQTRELYGYLLLTVELDFLAAYAKNEKIGDYGQVFFTDRQGHILFHPVRSLISGQVPVGLFKRLKASTENGETIPGDYASEQAHYQGRKLHDELYVFSVFPNKELVPESILLGRSVALITVFAILLTTAFLFGTLKTLLIRPIQQLGLAAREMGRGQVLVPIDVTSADEIGDLAKTFKEMGENLDRHHEQVRYVAYHDSLTGLPNRMMFKDYLTRATAEARRNLQELAVLFLDLDNFKRINDTLGHHAGDQLLSAFADRLSHCLRDTDVIAHTPHDDASQVLARLAGDEFIVLLPRTTGPCQAQKVAKRILDALTEPFTIEQQELFVSTSIGIALFPDDGLNTDTLLKNADIAMYHAKKLGRNNYQYYSKELNEKAVQRLKLESKLRRAVENDELRLHYQAQMNLATGRISGVEALLRWDDPELGPVSPEVFIPIAEEYGLIVQISEWVIREACSQAQIWKTKFAEPITMSINVSGVHFNGQELESLVAKTFSDTRLDPALLELELTETSILQDPELAINTLVGLKKMGLQISLDDFGTGYSSLSYVMKLPIDKLKIDQSFIRNLSQGSEGAAIVSAIIAMAHSLNLSVIAEGVEEQAHIDFLREKNCDIVQGFFIARPMSAEKFEQVMLQDYQKQA